MSFFLFICATLSALNASFLYIEFASFASITRVYQLILVGLMVNSNTQELRIHFQLLTMTACTVFIWWRAQVDKAHPNLSGASLGPEQLREHLENLEICSQIRQ